MPVGVTGFKWLRNNLLYNLDENQPFYLLNFKEIFLVLVRIRFVLRGWIRIRIWSISDRILNSAYATCVGILKQT